MRNIIFVIVFVNKLNISARKGPSQGILIHILWPQKPKDQLILKHWNKILNHKKIRILEHVLDKLFHVISTAGVGQQLLIIVN